jgi:hypothetical protein
MASRFEAWQLLGQRLFDDDLERFKTVAISVLRETDPELELAPDQRFAASMYGKEPLHTSRLKKGIAETLALLGTYPRALSACTEGMAKGTANSTVREVLSAGSWAIWASLNDVLPLLAEASPEAFSEAVDAAIHSEEGAFNKIFAQESSGIGGRTYITGVLWGLETLAWEPAYLVQVCRILSDLAAVDPGGNWTNRPSNSLTTILLPWLPQTCAASDKRHAAVRVVAKRQPEVGWKLVLSLLPQSHSSSSGTHKPIWRQFIAEEWKEGASRAQHWEDILAYAQLALEMAGNDVDKLAALVERYFHLPNEIRLTMRERLVSDAVLSLDEGNRFHLWTVLARLINNHRKFADHKNWQVPDGSLEELDTVAANLSPSAPEVRHKRLFGGVDADLSEEKGNWEEQEKRLQSQRQDAVREIVGKGGVELLLQFAQAAGEPWRIGFVYASLVDLAVDSVVLPALLESTEKALHQFAGGYVWGRHKAGGWAWVDSLSMETWAIPAKGQFFTFLPFCEETWARVSTAMPNEEKDYWQNTSANPYESTSGIETALDKLVAFDRPDVAIHCMQLMLHQGKVVPSNVAVTALALLKDGHRFDAYGIGEVLTFLQRDQLANETDVRRIEWKFLRILGEFHNGQPVFLSRWMAEDPDFFCEVIQTLFRSKKEEPKVELSDETKDRATNAYHLLHEWRLAPGSQRDGSFDSDAFGSWLAAVKTKCIESGHWEVAASQVGKVLFYAPRDEEGLWIEPICSVLDKDDHSAIRRGLTMEIFNSRGVFTPDGGKTEMALAEHWSQKAALAELKGFSLLGQELRRLADSYRSDAERESGEGSIELD